MSIVTRIIIICSTLILSSCASLNEIFKTPAKRFTGKSNYQSPAYKPTNRNKVKVKVSLSKQILYVTEGSKKLLVTAISSGKPGKETPKGNFKIYTKIKNKRSGTYGMWKNANLNKYKYGKRTEPPEGKGWKYFGYPMPYWCEFKRAYGFHGGYVWPEPHSAGCIRLHFNVAPKFYDLVRNGTPVNIAYSQPEDKKYASLIKRPIDYADPNPHPTILTDDKIFQLWDIEGELYEDQKIANKDKSKSKNKNLIVSKTKSITSNSTRFLKGIF